MREIRAVMRLAAHRTVESQISEADRLLIWDCLDAGVTPVEIAQSLDIANIMKPKILLHCEYLIENYFKK